MKLSIGRFIGSGSARKDLAQSAGAARKNIVRRNAPKWDENVFFKIAPPRKSFLSRIAPPPIWKIAFASLRLLLSKNALLFGAAMFAGSALAAQIVAAPNYDAAYDDVTPPKGAYGPVTIRKDKFDKGASAYGSKIVAVAAAAIEDELARGWCPAANLLSPSGLRIDTCAFQLGKLEILANTIQVFKQQKIGFKGTPSQYAPDLVKASGDINFRPDVWGWLYGTKRYFAEAVAHLRAYNADLVKGEAGLNLDAHKLDQLMEALAQDVADEADGLSGLKGGDFVLIGSNRAAFAHAKGVLAMTCELMKALEVDSFQIIDDRDAWRFFDHAKADACRASQIATPFFSIEGGLGVTMQELKSAAQASHASLVKARSALAAPESQ